MRWDPLLPPSPGLRGRLMESVIDFSCLFLYLSILSFLEHGLCVRTSSIYFLVRRTAWLEDYLPLFPRRRRRKKTSVGAIGMLMGVCGDIVSTIFPRRPPQKLAWAFSILCIFLLLLLFPNKTLLGSLVRLCRRSSLSLRRLQKSIRIGRNRDKRVLSDSVFFFSSGICTFNNASSCRFDW